MTARPFLFTAHVCRESPTEHPLLYVGLEHVFYGGGACCCDDAQFTYTHLQRTTNTDTGGGGWGEMEAKGRTAKVVGALKQGGGQIMLQ